MTMAYISFCLKVFLCIRQENKKKTENALKKENEKGGLKYCRPSSFNGVKPKFSVVSMVRSFYPMRNKFCCMTMVKP